MSRHIVSGYAGVLRVVPRSLAFSLSVRPPTTCGLFRGHEQMGYDRGTPPYEGAPKTHDSIFLRNHRDIEAVKHHGRRISTTHFNLQAYKMNDAPSRVGIVVGRRFGNAVRRNRAKRVFRELVRHSYSELVAGRGVLVFPKKDVLSLSRNDLMQAWKTSLQRMHLLRPDRH